MPAILYVSWSETFHLYHIDDKRVGDFYWKSLARDLCAGVPQVVFMSPPPRSFLLVAGLFFPSLFKKEKRERNMKSPEVFNPLGLPAPPLPSSPASAQTERGSGEQIMSPGGAGALLLWLLLSLCPRQDS